METDTQTKSQPKIRKVIESGKYKQGIKKLIKKHKVEDLKLLYKIVEELKCFKITNQYKNHKLNSNMKGYQELHVKNDLVLTYKYEKDKLYIDLSLFDLDDHDHSFKEALDYAY